MYDRHKPIIKWYEYDATQLYKNVESTQEAEVEPVMEAVEEPAPAASLSPEMDAEVARIMAAFSDAKQNSVDSVFASMGSDAMAF